MWAAFVVFIFCILLATFILVTFLYILATNFVEPDVSGWTPIQPLILISLISVLFGTITSAIAGKRLMKFMYELRDALKQVASGDFSVRLKERHKISEIIALHHDFNKMVVELNNIETLKDDFITSVSHEIKTPIAAIEGCVELLKYNTLSEDEVSEYINLLDISAKRLSVMTANVLRLSKLDNQEILTDQSRFSLDEQIRQSVLLLEHKWVEKDINLHIALAPVSILASKELLMQVWTNLLDNAIKFSNKGGDIKITLSQVADRAYVSIKDYGTGMQSDILEHIFQKFYQADENRSNQGNGLGLALVKRIIELTGGSIEVRSEFGAGSEFIVGLPLTEETAIKEALPPNIIA
jgi:signal transduction histidine kinase